jgi:four helix bundle protein
MKEKNIIREKSLDFALQIINLYKILKEAREYVFADQILRAGTSIGANVEEAGAAISKRDFIAKMSIASKEARETRYWLILLEKGHILNIEIQQYLDPSNEIVNILTAIVKTAQINSGNGQ